MNKIAIFTFTLIIFLGLCTSSCKQKENQRLLYKDIDNLLTTDARKPFNGIILIAKDSKIDYLKMCGFADLDTQKPFKRNHQFVIGSVSKQFTAAIVLQEYDKGDIDLHLPIKKYLPDLSEQWADTVTIHHLLSHTHGITALDKPTLFPVGTQYDYSQIGYDLLAKIAGKTSGKSFIELSSELFQKCNMRNTFHPKKTEYKNLVKGYMEDEQGNLEYTNESLTQYPAAGAFISTIEDLLLWNQNLFGGKLLEDNSFTLMTTKQDRAIRNHPLFGLTEYGYGITVDDKDGILQWGQTGFAPGFVSMNFYFPHEKMSVIILGNVAYDISDLKKTFYYHTQILNIVRSHIE